MYRRCLASSQSQIYRGQTCEASCQAGQPRSFSIKARDYSRLSFPLSARCCSARSYSCLVNTNSSSVLTLSISSPIHFLSSSLRMQFAHHTSILRASAALLSLSCSLCSFKTCRIKPALRCSRPNSDRHLKIREMRRLLCGASEGIVSTRLYPFQDTCITHAAGCYIVRSIAFWARIVTRGPSPLIRVASRRSRASGDTT